MREALAIARQLGLAFCCVLVLVSTAYAAAQEAPEFTHTAASEWLNSDRLVIVGVHTPELAQ
jgi:hypothetical protein